MRENKSRKGTIAVYAALFCFGAGMFATFLVTVNLDDNAYRLWRGVFFMNTTALCSILLYGALATAISVRIWAAVKKHHHIRWCSGWTIVITTAAYCFTAYLWSLNHSSVPLDAILHPLFWVMGKILAVLLYTFAAIVFSAVIYGLCRGGIWLKRRFYLRAPIRDYEPDEFRRGLDTLKVDIRRHPEFRTTCDLLQRELSQRVADHQRAGD